MSCLAARLTAATTVLFEQLALDPRQAGARRAERSDLADFQCDGALIFCVM